MRKKTAVKDPTPPDLPEEMVDIADMKPHPRNYQQHPEDQLLHLRASIETHGIYRNVVLAADGTILAGHGVVAAAERAGRTSVTARRMPYDPEDPRAIQLLVADNEIGRLAERDDRAMSELLRIIQNEDELIGTGFDEMQLANLVFVTRDADEIASFDEAAEWAGAEMPDFDEEKEAFKILINFSESQEREQFYEKMGYPNIQKKTGRIWSLKWPPEEVRDTEHLRWEYDPEA